MQIHDIFNFVFGFAIVSFPMYYIIKNYNETHGKRKK